MAKMTDYLEIHMPGQVLPILFSCPQRRYRIPAELRHPSELNAALEYGIRQYRQQALDEHNQVQNWTMSRLEERREQLHQQDPDIDPELQLIQAREQLQRECAIRFKLYPIASQLVLAVAVPIHRGYYYIDLDAFPIPHQTLTAERCESIWQQLHELQQTFIGLDMTL